MDDTPAVRPTSDRPQDARGTSPSVPPCLRASVCSVASGCRRTPLCASVLATVAPCLIPLESAARARGVRTRRLAPNASARRLAAPARGRPAEGAGARPARRGNGRRRRRTRHRRPLHDGDNPFGVTQKPCIDGGDCSARPLSSLVNTGDMSIDFDRRRIFRDVFCKGSFAQDTRLGWEEPWSISIPRPS
jgi:hypothetical protein